MTRAKVLLPLLTLALGAAATVVLLKAKPEVQRVATAPPPPLVRAVKVTTGDVALNVAAQGTVTPTTASGLIAQVAGRLEWVADAFADGGFFGRGEILVRIEGRDYELALEQAEARLAQARVRLELERAESQLARREWEELGEGQPTALTLREPQLAEARAGLQAAEAAVEQARLSLERTSIRAPFAGRVRVKRVDVGQYVAPGTLLAELYSTQSAEVRLPVRQGDLAFLDVDLGESFGDGPEVVLRSRLAGETRSWRATVVRTGSELDPRTRMLPLYARVEDPLARRDPTRKPLPMGLFVEAEIEGRVAEGVSVLPRAALRSENRVLIVDGEERLWFRPVQLLRVEEDRIVVGAGLEAGELVCVSPLETVVEGMRVRVREQETVEGRRS